MYKIQIHNEEAYQKDYLLHSLESFYIKRIVDMIGGGLWAYFYVFMVFVRDQLVIW